MIPTWLKRFYIAITTGLSLGFIISFFILQAPTTFFYTGVVDAYANMVAKKFVCRSINVYATVHDVIQNNATTFYLILDQKHVRGYFNNKLYDITSPDYEFFPENTTILKCNLIYRDNDIVTKCFVVYTHGLILKKEAKHVLESLNQS